MHVSRKLSKPSAATLIVSQDLGQAQMESDDNSFSKEEQREEERDVCDVPNEYCQP